MEEKYDYLIVGAGLFGATFANLAKEDGKKIVGCRCKICNYVYEGSKLPEDYACPLCGHGADDFEPIYES